MNSEVVSEQTSRISGTLLARAFLAAGLFLLVISSHAQPLPPPNPNVLLNTWSFSDTNWLSDSGHSPLFFTNIDNPAGWDGNVLQVDSTNTFAGLQYNTVENDSTTNLTVNRGTLEFWFKPNWNSASLDSGTGLGDWGRLIEVGEYTTNAASSWWSLYFSADGNSLNFSGQTNGATTNYLSYPISWDSNTWHFVALTYMRTRSQLYLDGQLVTNGAGVVYLPSSDVVSNGFVLGSDSSGIVQVRGQLDRMATYNYPIGAYTVSNDYAAGLQVMNGGFQMNGNNPLFPDGGEGGGSGGGEGGSGYVMPDYGTNLWIVHRALTNGYLTSIVSNTQPNVLYEIQSRTNLAEGEWVTEGFFNGSELTNWSPSSVVFRDGNLFLRIRSWMDNTDTGIPDWWWFKYFGQITNVNAYAASPAGDGYNNLQKFQMQLDPNVYYTTNAPAGFYGCFDPSGTNVVLGWTASSGPVTGYIIQRGIYSSITSSYTYSQYSASSNATFLKITGAYGTGYQQDTYTIQAVYPNGGISPLSSVWHPGWFASIGYLGMPYGPPVPNNVYAHVDASGTNVVLTWAQAQGATTNYAVLCGVYNTNTYSYAYTQIATVSTNTFSIQDTNAINSDNAWNNIYEVVAIYPGNGWSAPASTYEYPAQSVNIGGDTNSPSAPGNFYGYTDSTGTNTFLTWSAAPGSVANYIIYGGNYNYNTALIAYHQLAKPGAGASSFEVVGAIVDDTSRYDIYGIVASYSNGSLSQSVTWYASAGGPAPAVLSAYLDSTGTNVLLAWTAVSGPVTNYVISRSDYGNGYFPEIAVVSSNTLTYTDSDEALTYLDTSDIQYQLQAAYPNGGLSEPITTHVSTSPPGPTDVSVVVDGTGTNTFITWTPAVGSVSDYLIFRGTYDPATGHYTYSQIGQVNNATTSFTDTGAITRSGNNNLTYAVKARHQNNMLSPLNATPVYVQQTITNSLSVSAQLVRNQTGRWQLMFPNVPTNVLNIQVYIATYGYEGDWWHDMVNTDPDLFFYNQNLVAIVPVTNLLNGVYVIPDSIATNEIGDNMVGRIVGVQAIGSNERVGRMSFAGFFPYDAPCWIDGRQHLKQNLIHQLRAATVSQPDSIEYDNVWFDPFYTSLTIPVDANYVESSFFHWAAMFKSYDNYSPEYVEMDDLWPITANFKYHQSIFDTNYTGPANFIWQTNLVTVPASAILGIGDPYWVSQLNLSGYDLGSGSIYYSFNSTNLAEIAASTNSSSISLQSGSHNVYGLPFAAALVDKPGYRYDMLGQYANGSMTTLSPGSSVSKGNASIFYSQTDDPNLVLTNYYFATVNTPGTALPGNNTPIQPNPLPVLTGFAGTNQSGLMVASVGNPTVIGSWAKFKIQNGGTGKYAYLGQYFTTNGYFVNTNGSISTNATGVVSPYGNFFPTEPGSVALITMPDIDSGAKGTGVVRVISLNVDANHDGTMDFKYNSPDFVSTSKPFRFWINDNRDAGDDGGNFGVPGVRPSPDALPGQLANSINGRRDLVDFFPVCINIQSVLQAATNITVLLKQNDTALYFKETDLAPTNYMNFLRDTNFLSDLEYTATLPIGPAGRGLTQDFRNKIRDEGKGIILIEACKATTSPLVLEIWQGTNQIGQASLPLNITGVEQMFRHKNLLLSAIQATPDRVSDDSVPNEPDTIDKNFVFLHGYNVLPNEARGVAADVFKRMYWSGSHAKFWAVTWEGASSKIGSILTPNYHTNVANAFKTAPLLANFIATLTNSGPIVASAHSLGNMVTLSAISDWNAPLSQYFMLDAAVPIEAIDPTSTAVSFMTLSTWTGYSNRLFASDWYKLFPTNDARSTLSWNGRLSNLGDVDIYNFYSSGEEVLRLTAGDPPLTTINILATQLINRFSVIGLWPDVPFGTYTWYWQEKGKGSCNEDGLIGSSHGGWKFNSYWVDSNGNTLSPAIMNNTTNSTLQNFPMFNFNSTDNSSLSQIDNELLNLTTGVDHSAYAATNRNRILADAIPAMSVVAGANLVPKFSPPNSPTEKNIDLMTLKNGWSLGRTGGEAGKWHHSDFVQMAYPFTYQLFNQFVAIGNLK